MAGEEDRAKGTWDKTKGSVKEAAGKATNDERLANEGRMDQAKGGMKKGLARGRTPPRT
jgi:uncharacterized protein YjbJ (UPF0337 family)